MKKKKLAAVVAAVALIGAIGIGSTLAYFTDSDEASNVVTMGNVNIALTESGASEYTDASGAEKYGITFEQVMPGQTLEKDPTVTIQSGSQDAYVRVKMEVVADTATEAYTSLSQSDKAAYEAELNELEAALGSIMEENGWIASDDGYYYFESTLGTGAGELQFAQLFSTVKIPESWGNEAANQTFYINLNAEAIQADHFAPEEVNGVYGWYYSDGSAITAENYVAAEE